MKAGDKVNTMLGSGKLVKRDSEIKGSILYFNWCVKMDDDSKLSDFLKELNRKEGLYFLEKELQLWKS